MQRRVSWRHALTAVFALLLGVYSVHLAVEMTRLSHINTLREHRVRAAAPRHVVSGGSWDQNEFAFVFSSTCTPYQHWQALVLAHSFQRVRQHGTITRIVSGCSEADAALVRKMTQQFVPHLRLHFTRDYGNNPTMDDDDVDSNEGNGDDNDARYSAYNKPFGLRHWLRHGEPRVTASMVVLVDPDFLFNRRFVVNALLPVVAPDDRRAHRTPLTPYLVYSGERPVRDAVDQVVDGVAIGARWSAYLGASWFGAPEGNNTELCPSCANVTRPYALEFLSVGPPYVLTRHDAESMVDDYCNFTVQMRQRQPDEWMAEMYGYVISAAKHGIAHTTVDNLALGPKDDDYWGFAEYLHENPCDEATLAPMQSPETPLMMHGCHSFRAIDDQGVEWMYYKQLMPEDMFTCETWLLALPPAHIWELAHLERDAIVRQKKLVHAFGLCTWIKAVNSALTDFKHKQCGPNANLQQRLKLIDPRPATRIDSMPNRPEWLVEARNQSQAPTNHEV